MKIQDFEVEIVRELIPGESYTVTVPADFTGETQYENLRILEEHQKGSDRFKVGYTVRFKGAIIVISGTDPNINTSMIVTQSVVQIVEEQLSSIECTINDVIIDDYSGQFYTARLLSNDLGLKTDYINLIPGKLMKGIKNGMTIRAKGHYFKAKAYQFHGRRSSIPIFIIKQYESAS